MSHEQINAQTIQLNFMAADENNPDPATVGEFARAVVQQLSHDGYDVQPLYTGEKGGAHFIISMLQLALQHKDDIESAVGGFIGGAATNLGNIKTIIEAIEKIQAKLKPAQQSIGNVTVTLKADGTEIVHGTPEAVSRYALEHKKGLEIIIRVPKKSKKRRST